MQEDGAGGDGQPPIIVVKKVIAAGHHGGAWKVAYADFVTAMMALFMVLWLLNANQETKEAVSSYFHDPKGVGDKLGSGQAGSGSGMEVTSNDMENLAEHIEESMQQMSEFDSLKEQVQMTVTATGLRIELLETEQGMFFKSGSATPSEQGNEMLSLIVSELNKLPNRVALEGHTDAKPFRGATTYTNWELSVDRANSARRIMVEHGFPLERIAEVRGFADRQLRFPDDPELPANRRISLIVMYNDPEPAGGAEASETAGSAPGEQPLPHGSPASDGSLSAHGEVQSQDAATSPAAVLPHGGVDPPSPPAASVSPDAGKPASGH